jgi:cyclic beta-1,2-glucan synthetase
MGSALEGAVREEDRRVLLLAPPFDKTSKTPGCIKAYPPGIRENRSRYTRASTGAVRAAARLGSLTWTRRFDN